jgi:ribosome-associated protein
MKNHICLSDKNLESEISYITSRSGGAGGQHVNKVNTKVELRFNVLHSLLLSDNEKIQVIKKIEHRLTADGVLIIVSQRDRSQLQNKKKAIERFYSLIEKALQPEKVRKTTKPTKASVKKRLDEKLKKSEKKERRRIDW